MIAPHILGLSAFLSIFWGIYLVFTVQDYGRVRAFRPPGTRRRGDLISAFRRMLVALSLWSICFAYVFRTASVLLGFGDTSAAQIAFFAIIGINVPSAIFAVVSLKYD